MYLTYHRQIEKPEDVVNTIPHGVLSESAKDIISVYNCKQDRYYFDDNGFYFFLYLNNGDRIDIEL